ncbi:MAG: peptidase S41, partial [Muribaculaceae bacterium]|nr:peptidase S41 [Muribaculaceae bacterium]
PANIGLRKIPSFSSNNFDARDFTDLFEQRIMPTDGLIIDIRDNNGGNSEVGDFVMQLIATDTIPQATWETPEYQAAYASWGQKWHTDSVETPTLIPYHLQYADVPKYDKPIVLLINSGTFSAAENFTVLFRNAERGKIIGTPTGGSTGNPIVIDLGWGYYGMICTRREKLADGTEFIGVGINPDIIEEEAVGVLTGDDNVIRKALKVLRSEN